jgi:hypothetical protein
MLDLGTADSFSIKTCVRRSVATFMKRSSSSWLICLFAGSLCIGSFVDLIDSSSHPQDSKTGDFSLLNCPENLTAENTVPSGLGTDSREIDSPKTGFPEWSSSDQHGVDCLIRQNSGLSLIGIRFNLTPDYSSSIFVANQQSSFPIGFRCQSSNAARDSLDRRPTLIFLHVRLQV